MPVIKHGSGATSAFKTVKVSGQSDVVADAGADDLTFVAGSNVTITTDASADSVTIASSGGGGGSLNGIDDQSSSNDDQITITDTAVIINEDGADVDFRVEGSSEANLLFVNAGDDAVGIGTNTPNEKLVVSGNASVTGAIQITSNTSAPSAGAFIFRPASNELGIGTNSGERIRVNSSGFVGIGTTSPDTHLEVSKASADAEVLISAYHNTEATAPILRLRKADNSEASPAAVDDNAVLGVVDFLGHDGTNFERGAKIEARVDGTSGNNDLPTELTFWTTPDGSNTCAERLAIKPDGRGLSSFTAKCWANWEVPSGTVTLNGSHNVSSVTDVAVGYFTVNFANNLANTTYAVVGSAVGTFNGSIVSLGQGGGDTTWQYTDKFEIECRGNTTGTTVRDPEDMCAIVFGDN